MLDSGNVDAMVWRAARRHKHVSGADNLASGKPQSVRVFENRARLDDAGARLLNIRRIGCLQPRNLLVLVGDQRGPVEGCGWNSPAKSSGIVDFVTYVGAEHQEFLGHAAADHAGSAHPVLFRDHYACTIASRDPGGADPARTPSNHKQVDVELSHLTLAPRLQKFANSSRGPY